MTEEDRLWLIDMLNKLVDNIVSEGTTRENVNVILHIRNIYNELQYGVKSEV